MAREGERWMLGKKKKRAKERLREKAAASAVCLF